MENDLCPAAEIGFEPACDSESVGDSSRRTFLRASGLLMAGHLFPQARASQGPNAQSGSGHKVVLVVVGGVRLDETFSPEGMVNIPHLSADLLPKSIFYHHARNEGVTAHFNAISSIDRKST